MPDHPTCATCKHWQRYPKGDGGTCTKLGFLPSEHDIGFASGTDAYPTQIGSFDTGPSFYCPHHTDLPPRAA